MGLLNFDSAGVPVEGEYVALRLGTTGLPKLASRTGEQLERSATDGLIRPVDALAFLDAGKHFGNTRRHEAAWKNIRRAAGMTGARTLMCTAFDNLANDERTSVGGGRKELFMHDIGWEDGRSHNDAVRAAAADKRILAETSLIEMSAMIGLWHRQLQSKYSLSVYLRDNIHLNVWGQMRLSWELFSRTWPDLANRATPRSIETLARARWKKLKYGARRPQWSGSEAAEVVNLCTVPLKDAMYP
jgi:hypothetical protein